MPTDHSKVLQGRDFRWPDVALGSYKAAGADHAGVTRQTLLGSGAGEDALNFLTRYFEIEPGGYSSLERHRHPHTVVVVRGRGTVRLGERTAPVAPLDCVYVAPGTVHQFRAAADEPLGFLCIVDRVRDRPQPVTEGETFTARDAGLAPQSAADEGTP
jgi:quercetin dioxygenase-like cupin family protein